MRIGNLTQTVWKRSVKKQLHKRREAFLTEPLNGERCSAMKVDAQTSVVVAANASANGNTAKTAVYAAIRAVNDLACRGADPAGIRLQCFLPEAMTEEQFRDLIGEVEAFCEEHDLELINVAAETSPAVRQIFVQALEHRHAKADVGHKVAVHHVVMQHLCTGIQHHAAVCTQFAKISGKDRRTYDCHILSLRSVIL